MNQPTNKTTSLSYQNSTKDQMLNFYTLLIPSSVTIVLNLVSFCVVLSNQKIHARIKVCFIGHLLTDLGFGVSNLNIPIRYFIGIRNSSSCYWNVITYFGFLAVTSCMALLQTFDRFLVLKLTYSYVAWITATKMIIMVVLIYLCNMIIFGVSFSIGFKAEVDVGCLGLSGGKMGYFLVTVLFSVSIVTVVCIYIYIATVVRRHGKDIQNATIARPNDAGLSALIRDKKNLMTLAIIVILYIVCYTPITITLVQILWNWETRITYFHNYMPYHSLILIMANSIINPIIYIWRLKTTREVCHHRLVSCFKASGRTSVVESSVQQRQHYRLNAIGIGFSLAP